MHRPSFAQKGALGIKRHADLLWTVERQQNCSQSSLQPQHHNGSPKSFLRASPHATSARTAEVSENEGRTGVPCLDDTSQSPGALPNAAASVFHEQ